jgi:hypothetical protein
LIDVRDIDSIELISNAKLLTRQRLEYARRGILSNKGVVKDEHTGVMIQSLELRRENKPVFHVRNG